MRDVSYNNGSFYEAITIYHTLSTHNINNIIIINSPLVSTHKVSVNNFNDNKFKAPRLIAQWIFGICIQIYAVKNVKICLTTCV